MPKIISFFILFFTSFFVLLGQNQNSKISFIADWKLGESHDFRVTKIKESWNNQKLIQKDTTQYEANFKVIDSGVDSYKIQWQIIKSLKNSYTKSLEKIVGEGEKLSEYFEQNSFDKIIYDTNKSGEFLGISNWKEISIGMNKAFDNLTKRLVKKSPDKREKIKIAINPLKEIYTSKEGIEQVVFEEFNFFHFPMGVDLDIEIPDEYEGELPNFVGEGEPIRTKTIITVDNIIPEDFFCEFTEIVSLNAEDAINLVLILFKKMGLNENEFKDILRTDYLDITESNCYQFNYKSCLPYIIEGNKTGKFNFPNSYVRNNEYILIEMLNKN